MSSTATQLNVPLSHLVASRRNPRRVKPAREAHQQLVALIRSQGLLQPLVVRPMEDKPKYYIVIAGHRRLSALRDIHHGEDPRIPCILRDVDADTAESLSLGENFGHRAMHPLDEAEAFSCLATQDGKDTAAIAAEFGVNDRYVCQRMRLAALAGVVKTAYRNNAIDTSTAEAFAFVPEARQQEVWKELNGNPRHADHVRNIIAHGWIDAKHAIFDVSALPDAVVSRDLFNDAVLIERAAFMEAQHRALEIEKTQLTDDGWKVAVGGRYEEIHHLPLAMDYPEKEFDEATTTKLERIEQRRQRWEAKLQETSDDDEAGLNRVQEKLEMLEDEAQQIMDKAPVHYSEATRATGTAFLTIYPDGQVRREYRIPRVKRMAGSNAQTGGDGSGDAAQQPKPPTSDDLAEKQLAATFTHEALAVREALLKDDKARRRILALILHEKVRSEALAVRREANGTTLLATNGESFQSAAFERLKKQREKLDPFTDQHFVEDVDAYAKLCELPATKLDTLIDLLIVDHITAHLQRRTELVQLLAVELKVNIREHWRPTSDWLSGYQKIQLSHLLAELRGPAYSTVHETRKKSELVEALAVIFANAAEGKMEDRPLAERVNHWMPANLRGAA